MTWQNSLSWFDCHYYSLVIELPDFCTFIISAVAQLQRSTLLYFKRPLASWNQRLSSLEPWCLLTFREEAVMCHWMVCFSFFCRKYVLFLCSVQESSYHSDVKHHLILSPFSTAMQLISIIKKMASNSQHSKNPSYIKLPIRKYAYLGKG